MIRALPIFALLTSVIAVPLSRADQPDFRLQVVPAIVYKVDDPGNTGTSSWVFDVAVISPGDTALTPISASVALSNGRSIVERQEWTAEQLVKIKGVRYRISSETPIASPQRLFTLPEAFDLRFYFRCPRALEVGSADLRIAIADARGHRAERELKIPVQYYQQKTTLIVPFRGHGVVGQDWMTNGGHGGLGSGAEFALDLRALDEHWAEAKSDSGDNAAATGWGRDLLSPADGVVTYVRNDVPDNPHPGTDAELYAALHDPIMGVAGNCVMIDHGNSEVSVLMHMQLGSVVVKVGDRVVAGQVIGKLGNSGNAFGPHVHYQLQAGPKLFQDQGLPFKFENTDVNPLFRGRQFDTR